MKFTRLMMLLVFVAIAVSSRAGLRGGAGAGNVVAAGPMVAARFDHAAVLLPSGHVLLVGGIARNGVMQPSAELFDPATGKFSAAARPRADHGWGVTATLLRNGKVLVAGGSTGCESPCYTASAEIYDPATDTFSLTGKMTAPRADARAALLATGEVLLVGGEGNNRVSAELFHPESGTFSSLGMTDLSDATQILALKDGNFLVAGDAGTDVYEPASQRFVSRGAMTLPRTKFGGAVLPDGRALFVGGQTPSATRLANTQLYDPATGTFAPGPELTVPRFKLSKAVVGLKDGRVLIAGGAERPEIFDPGTGKFAGVGGATLDGFCFSTATVLQDGRVLLAGGYALPGGSAVAHAWVWEP